MRKTILSTITIAVLIFSLSGFSVDAIECGSIPSDGCTVSQNTTFQPGNYVLPGGISIVKDNVTLNCNNANLVGTGNSGVGVSVHLRKNIAIMKCNITSYGHGISSCTPSGGSCGFINNSRITDNWLRNYISIYLIDGSAANNLDVWDHGFTTIQNNYIQGEGIVGGFLSHVEIINNTFYPEYYEGIRMQAIPYMRIEYNNFSTGNGAIEIGGVGSTTYANISTGVIIKNNQFYNDPVDIELSNYITNVTIEYNTFSSASQKSIQFFEAAYNVVRYNSFVNNALGIDVSSTFSSSNIYNLIVGNQFINNVNQAQDYGLNNAWNDSVMGNYWSDYDDVSENCFDANIDNICDDPRPVPPNGIDFLPLIGINANIPAPILEPVANAFLDEMNTLSITLNASSFLPLTYSIVTDVKLLTPDMNFVSQGNVFVWQTNHSDSGIYNRTVIITDTNNKKTSQNISITVSNVPNSECSAVGWKNSCTVSQNSVAPINQYFNFKDGISITNSEVSLDCAHATFSGKGFNLIGDGLSITNKPRVSIRDCIFEEYTDGIKLMNSDNALIMNIVVRNNSKNGIYLWNSHDVNITQSSSLSNLNSGSDQKDAGIRIQDSNKTFLFLVTAQDNRMWGVRSENMHHSLFQNITVRQSGMPVNSHGMKLQKSHFNTVRDSLFQNHDCGSGNACISIAVSGGGGLPSQLSHYNHLFGLTIENTGIGIRIDGWNNSFTNSSMDTIRFYGVYGDYGSVGTLAIMNNIGFVSGPVKNLDIGNGNFWSINNVGNWWGNYDDSLEGCYDNDLNGICDSPYTFFAGNGQDFFPCTNPSCWTNKWPIFISSSLPSSIQLKTGDMWNYDANAVDPDNETLSYAVFTEAPGLAIDPATGVINYTVPARALGTYRLTIRALDNQGGYRDLTSTLLINVKDGLQPKTK